MGGNQFVFVTTHPCSVEIESLVSLTLFGHVRDSCESLVCLHIFVDGFLQSRHKEEKVREFEMHIYIRLQYLAE